MKNNNSFFMIVLVIIILFLAGCASSPSSRQMGFINKFEPNRQNKILYTPQINTPYIAEIGNALIVKTVEKITIKKAIILKERMIYTDNLRYTSGTFTLEIPAGKFIAVGSDHRGVFYRALEKIKYSSITGPFKIYAEEKLTGGVVIPETKDMPQQIYWNATDNMQEISYPLKQLFSYEYIDHITKEEEEESFKRELIYNGKAGSVIKLLYREFNNDFARPAFSQEITYDLSQSNIVGFKGSRLKILKADNLQINYIVLKPFD